MACPRFVFRGKCRLCLLQCRGYGRSGTGCLHVVRPTSPFFISRPPKVPWQRNRDSGRLKEAKKEGMICAIPADQVSRSNRLMHLSVERPCIITLVRVAQDRLSNGTDIGNLAVISLVPSLSLSPSPSPSFLGTAHEHYSRNQYTRREKQQVNVPPLSDVSHQFSRYTDGKKKVIKSKRGGKSRCIGTFFFRNIHLQCIHEWTCFHDSLLQPPTKTPRP